MASYGPHFLLWLLIPLSSTGIASGSGFQEFVDNDENLLYLAIGFLCFSVLFLFVVVLMVSIVVIRVNKILKTRKAGNFYHGNSNAVIGNPYAMPMSERATNTLKWEDYLGEYASGDSTLNTATNLNYSNYMDLIILNSNRVSLPRASVKIDEHTI